MDKNVKKCLGCEKLTEKRTMTGYRFFCSEFKKYIADDFRRIDTCVRQGPFSRRTK